MSFERWTEEALHLYDGGDAEDFVQHIRACYAEMDALAALDKVEVPK